ncbi:Pkinase-domain-containing protein [Hesseltinella vesiculosa]|uniref:cAMP-dependent protein kinase n=1 Tax=Hesseltinella vesiculosa TaxID=101127 RepID=A0A1X2GIW2_9FUNG|nr:Pkinase-domain-containing protein [Hesseltinella vesiculosa]
MPNQYQSTPHTSLPTSQQDHLTYNDQLVLEQRQSRPKLKIADFHIMRTLGTGSFGRVHLIQSRVNGRHYAMKVLKKSEVVRLKQIEHTNNEKHILETVAHPFLVNMWGTFQDDMNLYVVMDYVAGGELFSVLRRMQRFPSNIAKFYAGQVLLAIEYLHSKDIIYRDLKPENLLLDNHGNIKIIDFGFAKHVPDVTWTLCGTPDYLAPEVIQSKGYSKAVDWWSLGVLIYEMLAGQTPFYDDDQLKLFEKILEGKIQYPPHFDQAATSLCSKLLTADLSKRYGNLKGGSEDIKQHPWFEGVHFQSLLMKQVRAPYVPRLRGDGDASHFDKYPETNEQYGSAGLTDPYRHLFLSF